MYDNLMFIFLIILFGLMCCCFLGGDNGYKEGYTNSRTIAASKAALSDKDNTQPDHKKVKEKEKTEEEKNEEKRKHRYDNYNHFEQRSSGSLFYNKHGGTARISHASKYGSIITTDKFGAATTYSIISPASVGSQVYIGPDDSTATVVTTDDGKEIHTTSSTGIIVIYKEDKQGDQNDYSNELNTYAASPEDTDINDGLDTKRTHASATAIKNASKHENDYKDILNKADAKSNAVSKSQIPRGMEDLYILKSQVVPPNCPVCPTCTSGSSSKTLEKDSVDDTLKSSSMFSPMQGSYFGTSFGANMGADYNGSSEAQDEIEEQNNKEEDRPGLYSDSMPIPVLWDYTSFGM